jgi:WbqC-like protein family
LRVSDKRVAILQSSYIPWKGYFDIVNSVDEFILYDDVQFTRRDWRNRNRIKTPQGLRWLTIPVQSKGRYLQRVDETVVSEPTWARSHWNAFAQNYSTAPYFSRYRASFEEMFLTCTELRLSWINRRFIEAICAILGISTPLTWSTDYAAHGTKTERLVSLCVAAGATAYLSGPSARDYIEEEEFKRAGIELSYMDYSGYPEYTQLHPPFEHGVTILDLIFNVGDNAPEYMKSFSSVRSR